MGKDGSQEGPPGSRQGRLAFHQCERLEQGQPVAIDPFERSKDHFFGRRHGKTLSPNQKRLRDQFYSETCLDLSVEAPVDLRPLFGPACREVRLEIGFGAGEHLLARAKENPAIGYIGIEPFVNSMIKCLAVIERDTISNIRVYNDIAAHLLDWLKPGCLSSIDLLYPDPWPKKKHWKRRIVSSENLDRFARVLKPGGEFRFASDIDSYVNWTLQHIEQHGQFRWPAECADDWRSPYPGWPGTRYEAKALREGRTPAYLTFIRL